MTIRLATLVRQPFQKVKQNFGFDLFKFLLPPKFVAELVTYEGQAKGDRVSMMMKLPNRKKWTVEITEVNDQPGAFSFKDCGIELPWGICKWEHLHKIERFNEHAVISDHIKFSVKNPLLSPFVYLALYLGFLPRKLLYKKYFKKL